MQTADQLSPGGARLRGARAGVICNGAWHLRLIERLWQEGVSFVEPEGTAKDARTLKKKKTTQGEEHALKCQVTRVGAQLRPRS